MHRRRCGCGFPEPCVSRAYVSDDVCVPGNLLIGYDLHIPNTCIHRADEGAKMVFSRFRTQLSDRVPVLPTLPGHGHRLRAVRGPAAHVRTASDDL